MFRCMSITDSNAEYGYIYYQNDSRTSAILKETIVFNKLDNFIPILEEGDTVTKILKVDKKEESKESGGSASKDAKYIVHVRVPSGSNVIVMLRRTDR